MLGSSDPSFVAIAHRIALMPDILSRISGLGCPVSFHPKERRHRQDRTRRTGGKALQPRSRGCCRAARARSGTLFFCM